jgi:hypothetical protein
VWEGLQRTYQTTETRIKGHIWHYHPEKSAVAEHSINMGHCIQLHDTSSKVTDTEHHSDNIIRKEIPPSSRSLITLIQTLKGWKKFLSKDNDLLPLDLTILFLGPLLLLHFFPWSPLVAPKRLLSSQASYWPGQDSTSSCTPKCGLKRSLFNPASYWPVWDSIPSYTPCHISMSTPMPLSLHPVDGGSIVF